MKFTNDIPLISIIVTSFNQANTLGKTIESILHQKIIPTYEIIIGDDFSSDNTRIICNEYSSRYPEIIQTIYHEENIGVGANFAICVKKARGKYISVCAADDYWHYPDKLQLQFDYLERNESVGLVYTDYNRTDLLNRKTIKNFLKSTKTKIFEGSGLTKAFFEGKVPVLTLTVMFRKELFDKYVPADDYIRFRFPLEDWPTWLILSKYSSIGYIDISTGTYRYGQESISHTTRYEKIEKRFAREKPMYRYLCEMFPEDISYDERGYESYVKSVLLNLAYKKSDYSAAKKYAGQMSELGYKNLKSTCAKNWGTFKLFMLIKSMKKYYLGDRF